MSAGADDGVGATADGPPADTPPSERTRVTRYPQRARYDRGTIDDVLDSGLICHLAMVTSEGSPRMIPMMFVRLRDVVYVHCSAGSPLAQRLRAGTEVCLGVTTVDGLVLARSVRMHSMNYRSVVLFGTPAYVEDEELKREMFVALLEKQLPGRASVVRAPSHKELAQAWVFALPIDEASAKVRTGGALDNPDDLPSETWGGELRFHTSYEPVPDAHTPPDAAPPR